MTRQPTLATLAIVAALAAAPAMAADPTPIHGQDAMGDRGRTGPDGWVNAPITRDQTPTAQPSAAGPRPPAANALPNPGAGRTLPPGEDPGTPDRASSAPGRTQERVPAGRRP